MNTDTSEMVERDFSQESIDVVTEGLEQSVKGETTPYGLSTEAFEALVAQQMKLYSKSISVNKYGKRFTGQPVGNSPYENLEREHGKGYLPKRSVRRAVAKAMKGNK